MNTFGQGPFRWPTMRDKPGGDGGDAGRRRAPAPTQRAGATRPEQAAPAHEEQSSDFVRQAMNEHYR